MSSIEISKWGPFEKNTLRGFLEIQLPSGMCLRNLTVHEKNGRRRIGYPSKPFKAEDGATKYQNQVYFPDKAVNERFQKQVLSALEKFLATNAPDGQGAQRDIPF